MVKSNKKNKTSLIFFLILLVLLVFFYFFYHFFKFLTFAGAFLVYFLLILMLMSKITRMIIFPGSTWIHKKSTEYRYCEDLCFEFLTKVKEILPYTNTVSDGYKNLNKADFVDNLSYLVSIKENLEKLKSQNLISKPQKKLLKLLKYLKLGLDRINSTKKTFNWDNEEIIINNEETTIRKNSENIEKTCFELIKFLESYIPSGKIQKFFLFFYKKPLGDLDYMRANLALTVNCKEIWIPTDDHTKLDW